MVAVPAFAGSRRPRECLRQQKIEALIDLLHLLKEAVRTQPTKTNQSANTHTHTHTRMCIYTYMHMYVYYETCFET